MYSVGLSQPMTARHSLPDAAPGEREEHTHHYVVEIVASGDQLDPMGYLIDISELKSLLSDVLDRYRGAYLNALEEFEGSVPSLENISRIIFRHMADALHSGPTYLRVKVWEDGIAWAGYEGELGA